MARSDTGVMVLGGEGSDDISLLEILDHVLNQGVVIHGTIIISLAGVDLIYLGLNVVLTGIETAHRAMEKQKSLSRAKSAARPGRSR